MSDKASAKVGQPPDEGGGTAGTNQIQVASQTPENAEGKINPSAPGETGTTEKSADVSRRK